MSTAVDSVTGASSTLQDRGVNSMRSEDFFRLLVSELQNQDPFEPAKTADMVAQVSQIRSIELSKQLTDTLDKFASQQQTAGISDMLGKYVTAIQATQDGDVSEVSGVVTGVSVASSGAAVLELDTGQSVLASMVTHVTTPDVVEAEKAAGESQKATGNAKAIRSNDGTNPQAATGDASNTSQPGGLLGWLGRVLTGG